MKSEALRFLGLILLASVLLLAAYQVPGDIVLDFGPNDYRYVSGFREEAEIDGSTLIHWSRKQGRVRLPFILGREGLEMAFRYKRHTARGAEIRVFLGGTLIDRFATPQTDFTVRTMTLEKNPAPRRPLDIAFLAHSPDPRPLGLALDWLTIRPRGMVLPTPLPFLYLLGLLAGLYVFARLFGFSERFGLFLASTGTLALSLWVGLEKLAPLHAASALGARPHIATLGVWLATSLCRRRAGSVFNHPEARWALLAFYLGTLVRLMGLFHSEFYYPDVRTHSKFVSLIWTEGLRGFLIDHIAHQHKYLLGLQLVGDRWLAFPYPPLLYLLIYPLSRLQLPVDEWMKMVPTLFVGLEALVVFALAARLNAGPRAAAAAAWFHATARVVTFRLTVASYAALFGHFWDTLAVAYIAFSYPRLHRLRWGLGLAVLVAVSLLSYAGSALVLGLFIPSASIMLLVRSKGKERDQAAALALWSLAGAAVAVVFFYVQYLPELLPGWSSGASKALAGEPLIELRLTPLAALAMAAHRVHLFYGPLYGALILLGWPLLKGRLPHRLTTPFLTGTLFTFLGLNFLRSGLGGTHIFQFSKDDLVLLPFAAVVLGGLVERLGDWRSGWGRLLGGALLASWALWGCLSLVRDVRARFLRPDDLSAPRLSLEIQGGDLDPLHEKREHGKADGEGQSGQSGETVVFE